MSAVETENQALAGKAVGLQRLKAVPHDHGHFGPQGRKHLHTTGAPRVHRRRAAVRGEVQFAVARCPTCVPPRPRSH